MVETIYLNGFSSPIFPREPPPLPPDLAYIVNMIAAYLVGGS